MPPHASERPPQPPALSVWPRVKIESSTEKILRVVVTVEHTSYGGGGGEEETPRAHHVFGFSGCRIE